MPILGGNKKREGYRYNIDKLKIHPKKKKYLKHNDIASQLNFYNKKEVSDKDSSFVSNFWDRLKTLFS